MELRQLQELRLKGIPASRKDFIRLIRRQDADVDVLLDELIAETLNEIEDNSKGDEIQDKDKISLAIPLFFAAFAGAYKEAIQDYNADTAKIVADHEVITVDKRFGGTSNEDYKEAINFLKNQAIDLPESVRRSVLSRRYSPTTPTIGSQITTIQKESTSVVRSILEVGIREGKSAQDIARDIQMYIKPFDGGKRISPFQWIRDKLGQPVVKKITRGEVPAGSVSYNAFRIARTEVNMTYRGSVVNLHKDKPWVKGFNWNLSPSHPKEDICDDWAEGSPYTPSGIPSGHPHCMCYVTVAYE